MPKARGKYDKTSGKIGFHTWNLDAVNDVFQTLFENLLQNTLKEGLELATEQEACVAWFDKDGIDIRVHLPLDEGDDEMPAWTFTLDELVIDLIESNEESIQGGPITDESKPQFVAIATEMRRLADVIDQALDRK